MSSRVTKYYAVLAVTLLAAAVAGCGSGNREGLSAASGSPLFGNVATVGDTACVQCHSANTEALTGESLVNQYNVNSPHHVNGLGCESCHGGGAMHNGVGPIPFTLADLTPTEIAERCATCHDGVQTLPVNGVDTVAPATNSATTFASSNHALGTPSHTNSATCVRCHTHEGAVRGNIAGWTGTKEVITDAVTQGKITLPAEYTGITCNTCHQHGAGLRVVKGTDSAATRNLVNWDPNNNKRTDQFDLCTSCHTLYNHNGSQLLVDGNPLTAGGGNIATGVVGYHETAWYRILASTHYDNPNTGVGLAANVIEGYNLRRTGENPCFDCHGHEAKTATNPSHTDTTIHKEWAQSAHAGGLLAQKYAATDGQPRNAATIALAMNAGADDATGPGWAHYNWDDTATRGSCQACHTSTGISNYLASQNTELTGYDPANNSFSHLSGWSATGGSPQNELLYCWGCHSNAGTGAMRNTSQAIMTFTVQNQPVVISDAGNSTACIVCHGGRGSAGEAAATDTRSSRFNGHHAPTAGILYSEKTHIGYEYPGLSYANQSFFAHDQIGANAAGPCASCHMPGKSHSFAAVTHDGAGNITAITNQALCNTCHTPGGQFEITPAKMNEEKAGYAQASGILNNYVNNVTGFTNYLGINLNANSTVINPANNRPFLNAEVPSIAEDNAYGAFQNAKLNSEEPCAYVHNRFYAKRLLFDSIDWMDNGALNGTITIDATTFPLAAHWFGAATGTTGSFTATRP